MKITINIKKHTYNASTQQRNICKNNMKERLFHLGADIGKH